MRRRIGVAPTIVRRGGAQVPSAYDDGDNGDLIDDLGLVPIRDKTNRDGQD